MKKAELNKLRTKTAEELKKLAFEKKDTAISKNTRRDIAQILTLAKEVKLDENLNR